MKIKLKLLSTSLGKLNLMADIHYDLILAVSQS